MRCAINRVRGLLIAAFAVTMLATGVDARAQSATGAIEGTVVDQAGAVLPGASVTLVQTGTGVSRSVVSDANGLFRVLLLPVGAYELSVDMAGFAPRKQADILLTVGQTLTLRIEMRVAGVAEKVDVVGTTPVIETGRSQVSSTITETAVQNLPVNGRNFIDFALLTPGVSRDVRTGDISFAGQRGTLNSLVVDGADNNNTFFGQTSGRTGSGRAPYQFSQDAVKEFQVNSNSFSAEYGRAGGAVINVVTKSGTNVLSGSVFEFYRDKALNANNAINELNNRPKSPYHYHQFGGTLGGPLRRNRDFYFLNYDGQRNTQPNLVFLNLPASTPSDPATIAGINRLTPLAESWDRKLDQDVFLAKTDHQLNDGNRITVRYNHQNFTGEGFENGGAQNALEHTGASLVRTRSVNAAWTSVLGARLFNELKLQFARDNEPGEANSDNPEGGRAAGRRHGADDRSQQLQPARNDDQALAGRRYGHSRRRASQGEGRLRLPVRRHPESLPGLLRRLLHLPKPRLVRRRQTERSRRSCTSRTSRVRARAARSPIPTSMSTRSSRRTSGGRPPRSPSTWACATT